MASRRRSALAVALFFGTAALCFAAQRNFVFSNVHTVEQTGDVLGEHLLLKVDESGAATGELRTYQGSYDVETVPLTGKLMGFRLVLSGQASYGHVAIEGRMKRGYLDVTIKRGNGSERAHLPNIQEDQSNQ